MTTNSDGYPEYRRRNDGQTAVVRKEKLDNRWVIPYNTYLLSMFDYHLNVEVCSTIEAVKYLYKYVYKGHDKISFNVVRSSDPKPVDEIEQYQSGRWVSPCEAMWRIYGFDLFEAQPPVFVLPVHLQNMQSLRLNMEENLETVIANEKRARTLLIEWDKGQKRWFKRRTKLVVIGRIVFVSPSEGERYFLRILLLQVRGPKSFEDLRTVNGHTYTTFQEAGLQRHLIEEDNTVDMCLTEAWTVQMPCALRHLFAVLLIFCQPKDPADLWTKYYPHLSQNFQHKFPNEPNKVSHLTASSVENSLEAMGKYLKSFNLENLVAFEDDEIRRTKDIIDALDSPIPQECIDCCYMLNAKKKEAFDSIVTHVKEGKPGAFFIDGPGGTGKTFLYIALYALYAEQSSLAALIRETSLIIWDEASMAKKANVEALDLLLRDLCHPELVFGGNGELQTKENEFVQLPSEIVRRSSEGGPDPINEITSVAFPELNVTEFNSDIFTTRAILTPINDDVD
ncbi:uncharacterized protein LOC141630791 [Silene latifolia]|uniref:uncharacterized protein LOC141630791 n=1 Tax=Silene latifolia TaxID=37657 RepID=UPI003D77A458